MEGGTLSVVGGYFAAWGKQDRGVCSWIGAASCSGLLLMFLFREVGVEIFTRLLPGHSSDRERPGRVCYSLEERGRASVLSVG